MFGGIVAGTGRVVRISRTEGAALRLAVDLTALPRVPAVGASVSVAGVCLTVAARRGRVASFDVVGETLRRTTLGSLAVGDEVNLENALRVGDEIGGHEVSGHVDAVGTVRTADVRADETLLTVTAPRAVLDTLVVKGWVAVDGVSLTVADLGPRTFSVALIPTTLRITTLGRAGAGAHVNLEGDPLGRHVRKWLAAAGVRGGRAAG